MCWFSTPATSPPKGSTPRPCRAQNICSLPTLTPTTYRVLQSLANTGELDSVKGIEGETLYRHCKAKEHHHHLLCRGCGTAIELEAPTFEEWALSMGKQHGFSELEHVVEVTGYCPECTIARREEETQNGSAR